MTTQASERHRLDEGCKALGLDVPESCFESLLRYLDLLYVWNASAGLTTILRQHAVRLHLLDSLVALPDLEGSRCIDLGSGAGLPGLVLAVVRPDIDFVLCESNRRRSSFLAEAARTLTVANVRVLQADAGTVRERYSTVISRAFRHPPEYLEAARHLVDPDGLVVLMTTEISDDVVASLGSSAGLRPHSMRSFVLPGGGEGRSIVTFRPG
ncbi:MAG TPA: 16S rRNA (guanine(527)-N(7))-methyltransferase RsmG [Candidatus Binatia bacterium]